MSTGPATPAAAGGKKTAFTIAAILLITATCAAILLIGMRFLPSGKPAPKNGAALRTSPVTYVNRDGFYTYPPNNTSHFENETGAKIEIKTDEHGFRNPPGSLDKSQAIILGDSFIMAINTPANETLAARLNTLGLQTYNAGMDGYSTQQAAAALKWLLAQKKSPAKYIILAFYLGNDYRDNFCQDNPACSVGGRLSRIKNLGRPPSEIMASYPLSEIATLRNTPPPAVLEANKKTETIIASLAATCREKNAALIIAGIPSKAQTLRSFYEISSFPADPRAEEYALETVRAGYSFDRPNDTLAAIAKSAGAQYLPLLPIFRSRPPGDTFFAIDHHWNPAGQQAAAQEILKLIAH